MPVRSRAVAGDVGGKRGRRGGCGSSSSLVVALEQGIFLQEALDFLIELQGRQLQQPDRLLQLRREREVLG